MKRLILAVSLLMLCLTASAQKFGISAGLTSSSLKEVKNGNLARYHVGAVANFPLGLGLALQPEFSYFVKGSQLPQKIEYSTGYGELGLQAQWGVDLIIAKPYVFVEPFLGGAFNNSFKGDGDSLNNRWGFLKRFEYGVAIGAGLEILYNLQLSGKYFWNGGPLHDARNAIPNSFEELGSITDDAISQIMRDKGNFNGFTVSLAYFF